MRCRLREGFGCGGFVFASDSAVGLWQVRAVGSNHKKRGPSTGTPWLRKPNHIKKVKTPHGFPLFLYLIQSGVMLFRFFGCDRVFLLV